MANQDRVAEVYKDDESPSSARTRRRVDWMCGQAAGLTLDLGCSQGIASIIVGRRGLDVVGVEIEHDRLEYAMKDLGAEADEVRTRVRFVHGDGLGLPFPDEAFDTVLFGEVIEHLPEPGSVLSEIARVVRPDGQLVLTTPFGYHPHPDHRHTFYVGSLLDTIAPWFTPQSVDIVDKYFRVVAQRGSDPDELTRILRSAQPKAETVLLDVEQQFLDEHRQLVETTRELSTVRKERTVLEEHARLYDEEAAKHGATRRQLKRTRERLHRIESTLWWRTRATLGRVLRRLRFRRDG